MSRGDGLLTAARGAACGLLLVLAVGCGPSTASVSGTVTFKGKPLPSGTVLFHGENGRVEHGLIGEDGRYTIANPPLGPIRITVRSHAAMPTAWPSRGKAPPTSTELASAETEKRDGKYVAIPPRYRDPKKSDLTYTVREGSQAHDIELQP